MKKDESSSVPDDLSFRYANKDDELLMLAWRNNINVRRYSRNTEAIEQSVHAEWLRSRLIEIVNQPLFIFHFKERAVGVVRLERINESPKIFEISIQVDESFQNRGFATSMISQVLLFAKKKLLATEIRAIIHQENSHSIRLFSNLNFLKTQTTNGGFEEYRIYL